MNEFNSAIMSTLTISGKMRHRGRGLATRLYVQSLRK